jgi:hypothetical protein
MNEFLSRNIYVFMTNSLLTLLRGVKFKYIGKVDSITNPVTFAHLREDESVEIRDAKSILRCVRLDELVPFTLTIEHMKRLCTQHNALTDQRQIAVAELNKCKEHLERISKANGIRVSANGHTVYIDVDVVRTALQMAIAKQEDVCQKLAQDIEVLC